MTKMHAKKKKKKRKLRDVRTKRSVDKCAGRNGGRQERNGERTLQQKKLRQKKSLYYLFRGILHSNQQLLLIVFFCISCRSLICGNGYTTVQWKRVVRLTIVRVTSIEGGLLHGIPCLGKFYSVKRRRCNPNDKTSPSFNSSCFNSFPIILYIYRVREAISVHS